MLFPTGCCSLGEGLVFQLSGRGVPDVGWYGYAPLTEPAFSRGHGVDYWIVGLTVAGIGTVGGASTWWPRSWASVAGKTLRRLPLFAWMMLATGVLILFALPPLTAAQIMLLLDRNLGAHFFDTQAGGSALLWQHFFWFLGIRKVNIVALPGFGIISEVVPVFRPR